MADERCRAGAEGHRIVVRNEATVSLGVCVCVCAC